MELNKIQKSIDFLSKQAERIYLKQGEQPPEGTKLYQGPKGGTYYFGVPHAGNTEEKKLPLFEVDAIDRLKPTINQFKKNISEVFENLPKWHVHGASFLLTGADELSRDADGKKLYQAGMYNSVSKIAYISEIVGELTEKDIQSLYEGLIQISPNKAWKLVVLHEMAHRLMDFQKVFPKYIGMIKAENNSKFSEKPKAGCTQYALTNYKERFAEAYVFYVENPKHLEQTDKAMYGFMKDVVFEGKHYSEPLVKEFIGKENLPKGSYWMESEKFARMLKNRHLKEDISKEINSFLLKAYAPGGSYVPVTTLIHRKDGSVSTAIRWKKYEEMGLTKIKSNKDLPAVRNMSQTPAFTKGSAVKQTMFLLVDKSDIDEIYQSNFVTTIKYEFLGEGLYLYSSLELAREKAAEQGKDILPVKVNVTRLFSTTLEGVREQTIENISSQGYEAIVLMRSGVYEFDLFCFDNRDVVAIGENALDNQALEGVQKSIEDDELQDSRELVTKEYLSNLKCFPASSPAGSKIAKGSKPVKTPMKADGSVDYDKVGAGESIWVTVTAEGSPLKGRPIIITKKPNGLFALTGGSGFSSMSGKDKKEVQQGVSDPYRHMTVQGKPELTDAEIEKRRQLKEAAEENKPFIERKKVLETQQKEELDEFRDKLYDAYGVKQLDKNTVKQHRDELIATAMQNGLDEESAKAFSTSFMHAYVKNNKKVVKATVSKRALELRQIYSKFRKGEITEEQCLEEANSAGSKKDDFIKIPSVSTRPENIEKDIDEQGARILNPNPEEDNDNEELKAQGVDFEENMENQILLAPNIEPLKIQSVEQLANSVKAFEQYHQTKKEIDVVSKKIRRMNAAIATPAMVEQLIVKAKATTSRDVSDEEWGEIISSYDGRDRYNNSAIAFYDAVSEKWNNETSLMETLGPNDNSFGGYVDSGAASALAALSGKFLGQRVDVKKLIEKTNVETATMLIALDAKQSMSPEDYDSFIGRTKEINARTLKETEQRALDRHAELKRRQENYAQAKKTGLMQPREAQEGYKEQTGMVEGEVENLIEQKKNLGTALGSMQASADLLHALEVAKSAKYQTVSLDFGSDMDGATLRANELGLLDSNRGRLNTSDPKHIKIETNAHALSRYMKKLEVTKSIHDRNEKIKNDMSGTAYDDGGNLVAEDYAMPGANETYKDEEGNVKQFRSRVEQRNDIRFLGANGGSGLITRVTGAGKTNTCYGFFAEQQAKDKNYSAMVVVPKGRAGQWVSEAKKFFNLDVVLLEGEGLDKETRSEMIAKLKPGQIAIMSQPDAITNYADLEMAFNEGQFKGLVLDEPQEVASKSMSGNMSATLRKLMKLKAENRIALTATPARDNLIEAYDLVNWVSKHDPQLGPRTRFQSAYGGYGSGTNAQDATLQQMIYREISPYVSGDRLTNPNFQVSKKDTVVKKSPKQDANMRKIELEADKYIKEFKAKAIKDIENTPNSLKWYQERHGDRWRNVAGKKATDKAREEIKLMHEDNLSGISDNMTWQDNPKISSAIQRIASEKNKKHVIYVDNAKQRAALQEGLLAAGFSAKQVKNMASSVTKRISGADMARHAREFRTDRNVRVIFIDKKSSSGYNLQSGDDLHVIGTPSDAAVYLQAQGRIARMPRKGDVNIHTYKYDDVPFEDTKWTKLENQLAILRAVSPGLFSEGKKGKKQEE